jgi:hypothetical protein
MIFLFALLTTPLFLGAQPVYWTSLIEVQERHEFYQDNELITKPRDSWQVLFAVVFPDRNLNMHKDCVFYRVPGEDAGIFKIKAVGLSQSCEKSIDEKGDVEISDLKALQFSFANELTLHFTFSDYRMLHWQIPIMNKFKALAVAPFMSSAQFRAPRLILLAPVRQVRDIKVEEKNSEVELCHDITDNCEELSPSTCQQCPEGWYEVPNGCSQGPKYCGMLVCGLKDSPACRRGMKYQRVRKKYECRTDTSFAYCAPGLIIQCSGNRAYCR